MERTSIFGRVAAATYCCPSEPPRALWLTWRVEQEIVSWGAAPQAMKPSPSAKLLGRLPAAVVQVDDLCNAFEASILHSAVKKNVLFVYESVQMKKAAWGCERVNDSGCSGR